MFGCNDLMKTKLPVNSECTLYVISKLHYSKAMS